MKNNTRNQITLDKYNVSELTSEEIQNTNGGTFCGTALLVGKVALCCGAVGGIIIGTALLAYGAVMLVDYIVSD